MKLRHVIFTAVLATLVAVGIYIAAIATVKL